MYTYTETQTFDRRWLLFFVVIITAYFILRLYLSAPLDKDHLILVATMMLVFLFLYAFRLTTTISRESIKISLFPLTHRTVLWSDVQSVEVIDYGFLGGWGLRTWTKYGTIYNIKGSMGLHVYLKNGKQFVIGTQRPEELAHFIKNLHC